MSYAYNTARQDMSFSPNYQSLRRSSSNSYHIHNGNHRVHRRNARFSRNAVIACLCMSVLIIFALTFFMRRMYVEANNLTEEPRVKQFTSVMVEEGDSLWSLSEKYMSDEYNSEKEYMEEIKYINGIEGESIHAGQYITVPYYTALQ